MGLRAEKQRRQRRLIIENAIALFGEAGFERTRVREIAARAAVSEATFFNYFASKEALLREWLEQRLELALARAADRYRDGASLRRVVRGLADAWADELGARPALAARALAASRWIAPAPDDEPARGRVRPPDGAAALFETARARGEIRADVDPDTLAGMLRAVLLSTAALASGARPASAGPAREDDAGPSGALAPALRAASDLLLDGLRKRNERVRAPAARGRAASAPAGS